MQNKKLAVASRQWLCEMEKEKRRREQWNVGMMEKWNDGRME